MSEPRPLGNIYSFDPRDALHRAAAHLPTSAADVRRREWEIGPTLDQDGRAACVAAAYLQLLQSGPVKNSIAAFNLFDLYTEFQRNDEWPGEEPAYEGTSLRAGAEVLKALGYFTEYLWASDRETSLQWLLNVSPEIFATNWYTGMDQMDKDGYLWPTGSVRGRHAYEVFLADRDKMNPDGTLGAMRMIQSWGNGYYDLGRAWLTFGSVDKLLNEGGQVVMLHEVQKGPAPPPPPDPPPTDPPIIIRVRYKAHKRVIVDGDNFDDNAALLLDDERMTDKPDDDRIIHKVKGLHGVHTVQVVNPNGKESALAEFTVKES